MTNSKWTAADLPSFEGRTVVITGANSGLGLITARELARVGARVVLAVRNTDKGAQAASSIAGKAEVRALDLADLSSIRRFAEQWSDPIDVLVNNAGIMMVPKSTTADGFESQFGTNHLGHFALTNLLLPHITDRVVTLSSQMHRRGSMDLADPNWRSRKYDRTGAYAQSKLANLLFTVGLDRRLEDAGSPVRAMNSHPGYAATNLQSHYGNPVADVVMKIGNAILAQSAEAGARPSLYAISSDIPTGSYVGPDGIGEMRGYPTVVGRARRAQDTAVAEKLWALSEELTGVTFPAAALGAQ